MYPNMGQGIRKASTGDNQVVITGKCILHRIIVGADVASGAIELSDSATDGDENIILTLAGSTLRGSYDIGIIFEKGITVDQTNQTNVTYVVSPTN